MAGRSERDGAQTSQKFINKVSQLRKQPCDSFLDTHAQITTPPFAEKWLKQVCENHRKSCTSLLSVESRKGENSLRRQGGSRRCHYFSPLTGEKKPTTFSVETVSGPYQCLHISWFLSHIVKFKSRSIHSGVFEKKHPNRK